MRSLACGFAAQGFKRGDHLAIVGDNRPRVYAAMCAAQCLGGIPVPLYQDAVAAEMAFPIQNAEIAFALVEDQEQVDKLLEILPQCPTLAHIYYDEPRGLRHYNQPQLMSCDKLLELGREFDRAHPAFSTREIAKGAAPDTAAMFFTSGTTGHPEGRRAHPSQPDRPRAQRRRGMEGLDATRTWCSPTCRRPGSGRTSFPTRSRSSPATASAAPSRPRR